MDKEKTVKESLLAMQSEVKDEKGNPLPLIYQVEKTTDTTLIGKFFIIFNKQNMKEVYDVMDEILPALCSETTISDTTKIQQHPVPRRM